MVRHHGNRGYSNKYGFPSWGGLVLRLLLYCLYYELRDIEAGLDVNQPGQDVPAPHYRYAGWFSRQHAAVHTGKS